MPKITKQKIEMLPEDRYAVNEVSPNITASEFNSIFEQTKEGEVQQYFKFLEEFIC